MALFSSMGIIVLKHWHLVLLKKLGIKYKYLLINTHIVRESFLNTDINTGEYRKVDLFSHPFFINSKDVLTSFEDSMADTVNKRVAILLKKSSVPTSLNF